MTDHDDDDPPAEVKINKLVAGALDYAKISEARRDWSDNATGLFESGAGWMIQYLLESADRQGLGVPLVNILNKIYEQP